MSNSASWEKQRQLISWMLNNYEMSQQHEVQRIFLEQACKDTMAGRYVAMVTADKHTLSLYNELGSNCKVALKESKLFAKRKLFVLNVLFRLPSLYRVLRIISDPTLLTWERLIRKRISKKESQK